MMRVGLCGDATDGHFRIREVTFVSDAEYADSDIKVTPDRGAYTTPGLPGIGKLGRNIVLGWRTSEWKGYVLAHELGHYVFGLGDEYASADVDDAECVGPDGDSPMYGVCIPPGDVDHEHYCLMQSEPLSYDHDNDAITAKVEIAEFCVPANHDLDGYANFCIVSPEDETKAASLRTRQTDLNHQESCWETIKRYYPAVAMPSDLPAEDPPSGYIPPSIVDKRQKAVALLLDRSGSMAWSVAGDFGEICENGVDDDGDGKTDEDEDGNECHGARLNFLRAGMRSYLRAHADSGHMFAVVSFSHTASTDKSIGPVSSNLSALVAAIDALTPAGSTAIGDGLDEAASALTGVSAAYSKRVELFSDGFWNAGADPVVVANYLRNEKIVVDTRAAGRAVDNDVLLEIARITGGWSTANASSAFGLQSASTIQGTDDEGDSSAGYSFGRNADNLVGAYLNRWARSSGGISIVPEQRYHTNLPPNGGVVPFHEIPADAWFTGADGLDSIPDGAEVNRVRFEIAPDTEHFRLALAGNLPRMSRFAVSATLFAPDGSIQTLSNPAAESVVTHDPFYESIRVDKPVPGEWIVEIGSGNSEFAEQTGYLTVVARQPVQKLALYLPKRLVSVADGVDVVVDPRYVTTVRDLGRLSLRLTDPSGGVQSVPLVENADGFYHATISDLKYVGSHEVAVIAETVPGSWRAPLEFSSEIGPVAIPALRMGASDAFFVVDGVDVAPVPRSEG